MRHRVQLATRRCTCEGGRRPTGFTVGPDVGGRELDCQLRQSSKRTRSAGRSTATTECTPCCRRYCAAEQIGFRGNDARVLRNERLHGGRHGGAVRLTRSSGAFTSDATQCVNDHSSQDSQDHDDNQYFYQRESVDFAVLLRCRSRR